MAEYDQSGSILTHLAGSFGAFLRAEKRHRPVNPIAYDIDSSSFTDDSFEVTWRKNKAEGQRYKVTITRLESSRSHD